MRVLEGLTEESFIEACEHALREDIYVLFAGRKRVGILRRRWAYTMGVMPAHRLAPDSFDPHPIPFPPEAVAEMSTMRAIERAKRQGWRLDG